MVIDPCSVLCSKKNWIEWCQSSPILTILDTESQERINRNSGIIEHGHVVDGTSTNPRKLLFVILITHVFRTSTLNGTQWRWMRSNTSCAIPHYQYTTVRVLRIGKHKSFRNHAHMTYILLVLVLLCSGAPRLPGLLQLRADCFAARTYRIRRACHAFSFREVNIDTIRYIYILYYYE